MQQLAVGHALEKGEAPSQRGVEQLDAAISGIHRAQQKHVERHAEGLLALRQGQGEATLVSLEQRQQLAHDLGDVATVNLVNQQEIRTTGIRLGGAAHPLEETVFERQRQPASAAERQDETLR